MLAPAGFSKHYPLWGGITNLNLNRLWVPDSTNATLDYFRGVSTGPVTPLVLSVTTFEERFNLGLSFRAAVFSRRGIENLPHRFRELLQANREAA
jgi:hypothetical protein